MNNDQFYQFKSDIENLKNKSEAVGLIQKTASRGLKSEAQLNKEWTLKWIGVALFLMVYSGYIVMSVWFAREGLTLGSGFLVNMALGVLISAFVGDYLVTQQIEERHWYRNLDHHLYDYDPYDQMAFINLKIQLIDKNVLDCDLILDWAMTEQGKISEEMNRQVMKARDYAAAKSKRSFLMPIL